MSDVTPRSVSVNLETGLVVVRNVRTRPYISYTDDGKAVTGAQIVHDMIFHLDSAINTNGMDASTRKLIVDGLRNESKQLVIDYQRLLRPEGPAAFEKTPEININTLRNGGGTRQTPLQGLLRATAKVQSIEEIDQAITALKARKQSLAKAATASTASK